MTTNKLTEETINKITNWWAEQLKAPTFDNGDPSTIGNLCRSMAKRLSDRAHPSEEQLTIFKDVLAEYLREEANLCYGCLGVDYHPTVLLARAADAAGIPLARFPWKTSMTMDAGKVFVRLGYGAPWQEI